ncbi:hypothetical protein HN51_015143 [Arachis hypogaea]|uniref:Fe2OG dioxygenase domain-containing protein n=1 Tax=Arachis hypogaea TaxID=3818 RepID=A0A445CLS7_ARAHY|nr:2-oxoglutarate-dependent dioxygenase AOP3 [Arachis hypogaea]QHO44842.1 putative 2-oxoglutarate-dependent dioxygenase AOP1 [Arachis hypogaea]RYR51891.1 hypothetical protein Ahy_A06g026848 [Arachis hypogaea]
MGSQTRVCPFPVIDLSDEKMKAGTEAWVSACRVARTGMEEHGCFVVRFDKVGESLCKCVVSAMEELFGLPVETKAQKTSEKLFHGYLGQVSWIPLYESLGIDDPFSMPACQHFANIMWPQGNNRFCERINEYAKLMGEIDHIAKRMVFESYGVDMERCKLMIESSDYLLRCQEYRPPKNDEDETGLQPHTDLTITSIVHQLNNLNGLEIKASDGIWRGVDASPSSFVVMAGDAFKVWSNGRIRPCEHRVTVSSHVKNLRYSTGLFSFCSNTFEIPQELVNQQHPLRYKTTFHHYDYLHFFDESKIKDLDTRIQAYCGISSNHE